MTTATELLRERITAYLCTGGLFNPELANHDAVRNLLIDCRDFLSQPEPTMSAEEVREACARIARAHIGQAEKERRRKGFKLNDEVQAEERGETIAAEIIELNIRSLDLSRKEK